MWLLPTRRRLQQLQLVLDRMVETGLSTPGVILVHASEFSELVDDYKALSLPKGWAILPVQAEGMAAKVQAGYEAYAASLNTWVGVFTDDMWPETPNWDRLLIDRLKGWNVISGNDLDQAPKRMESATVWSADLVKAVGYLSPPGLQHLFFDDVWERLGRATACLEFVMDVHVAHKPKTYGSNPDGTAMNIRSFHDADERRYRAWVEDEFPAAVDAVLKCAETHGIQVSRPDLRGVSLYLTTPSGEGQFDRRYVRSLMQTIDMVRSAGGKIDWGEMPYCADLSLSRNRIFGAFLRSRHTHMLMVDDDMGWQPQDVLRLLQSGYDFVGGAGPKKLFPLRFCVYSRDEHGREFPGLFNPADNSLEVTGIGTGFLMITRACAEKMAQAYSDLRFDPGEGQVEVAVFDPLILPNKTRLSDDFAFCFRWRRIGGKVHALPVIRLAHVGHHCFEGALMDAMLAEAQHG